MQKTTIRQVPLDKPELFRVRILFLNVLEYHRPGRIAPHSHDHWQMEVVRRGKARVILPKAVHELKTGDVFFIAPGDRHHFEYPAGGSECVSVKFSLSPKKPHPPSGLFSGGKWALALKHALVGLLPNAAGEWTDEQLGGSLLSHQIAALMEIFHRPRDPVSPRVDLEKSIRALVDGSEGRPLSVKEIARKLGYSRNYLSEYFHTKARRPLKRFIDEERALIAKELLLYSDRSVTEIARQMGFPETLSFSRFCTRHLGKSPRAFRKGEWENRPPS